MTNAVILGKAILKAGKKPFRYKEKYSFSPWDDHMKEIICGLVPYEPLIFSHDFAKAFWGIKHQYYEGESADTLIDNLQEWQYHLQQMVLEPEPLKYLEKFL